MENTKNILNILSQYKGIIYDFDGTIATLSTDWALLKQKLSFYIRKRHDIDIEFTPLDKTLLNCKLSFGIDTYLDLMDIIQEVEYNSDLLCQNDLLVSYIRNSSQLQGIYSMNTSKALNKHINNIFGGHDPFQCIISKNTCKFFKPSGVDIELIYNSWGMTREDIVYIGNSESDKISGEIAQVRTLIV